MYRIKKLTNCGNIDFDQNPYEVKYGTQTLVNIKHKKKTIQTNILIYFYQRNDMNEYLNIFVSRK